MSKKLPAPKAKERRQVEELAGVGLTTAPLFIPLLDQISSALGFAYTPALLLMLAVVGLLLLIFQLSLSLTRNSEQVKVLTQELGLLRHELEVLARKTQVAPPASPAPKASVAFSEGEDRV